MREDPDHPAMDTGHPKHLKAIDRIHVLMDMIDTEPAEKWSEGGIHTTAALEKVMGEAMPIPEEPSGYAFEAYTLPEGAEWDNEAEDAFRGIFHEAQLSQPEVDQLLMLASSDRPDPQHTETVLKARYQDDEALLADVNRARAAIEKFGGQGLKDFLNTTGLGDSVQVFDLALRKAKELEVSNG